MLPSRLQRPVVPVDDVGPLAPPRVLEVLAELPAVPLLPVAVVVAPSTVVLDDRVVLFANPEDAAEYIGFDLKPIEQGS